MVTLDRPERATGPEVRDQPEMRVVHAPTAEPSPLPTVERPASRVDELAGRPGQVRFLDLPARRFVMIDGEGAAEEAAFRQRMPGLYATAYGLRFAPRRRVIEERIDPLEGLWWTVTGTTDVAAIFAAGDRSTWRWTLMIGLPDQSTDAELSTAVEAGRRKLAEPSHRTCGSRRSPRAARPSSSTLARTPPSAHRSNGCMRRSRRPASSRPAGTTRSTWAIPGALLPRG